MKKQDWFWVLTSLFAVIAIDQVTKYAALNAAPKFHWGLFHMSLHFNKGAMLGLFSDLSPILRIVSLSTGGAFLLFSFTIFQYLLPTRSIILRVGMSILIAGILGNVIDRTIWGHVIDFIIIGNKQLSTGVFNMADVSVMIGAGLVRLGRRQPREEIEYAMEEGLLETMPRLEKRTQYLATLANISTLLGLLGTIIGLIAAFTAVASADPAQKASLLSQSISVAMNTTAFGLMAAIPLLLIHSVIQAKTNEIVDSFEMAGIKVMNVISDRPAAAPQQKAATPPPNAAPAPAA